MGVLGEPQHRRRERVPSGNDGRRLHHHLRRAVICVCVIRQQRRRRMSEKEKEHGILRAHDLAGLCCVGETLVFGFGFGSEVE